MLRCSQKNRILPFCVKTTRVCPLQSWWLNEEQKQLEKTSVIYDKIKPNCKLLAVKVVRIMSKAWHISRAALIYVCYTTMRFLDKAQMNKRETNSPQESRKHVSLLSIAGRIPTASKRQDLLLGKAIILASNLSLPSLQDLVYRSYFTRDSLQELVYKRFLN